VARPDEPDNEARRQLLLTRIGSTRRAARDVARIRQARPCRSCCARRWAIRLKPGLVRPRGSGRDGWIGTALAWLAPLRLATTVAGRCSAAPAPAPRRRGRWRCVPASSSVAGGRWRGLLDLAANAEQPTRLELNARRDCYRGLLRKRARDRFDPAITGLASDHSAAELMRNCRAAMRGDPPTKPRFFRPTAIASCATLQPSRRRCLELAHRLALADRARFFARKFIVGSRRGLSGGTPF